jgi:hypothetical protein
VGTVAALQGWQNLTKRVKKPSTSGRLSRKLIQRPNKNDCSAAKKPQRLSLSFTAYTV